MAKLQNALPMRWVSGPLEIAKRSQKEALAPRTKEVIEKWHEPAALDILKGSAIDCLVVSWAAGAPEDAAQQKSAGPLLEAARARGLSVVGWVEGKVDPQAAIASAKSAGLTAVALPGYTGQSDFPVISWGGQEKMPWDAKGPVLAATDNVWPGLSAASNGPVDADAGPTGLPWLDSNGWFIQMVRARAQAPLWLMFDPPATKGEQILGGRYITAICDSESAGGRWVISLDDDLRAGLTAGSAPAVESLKQIGRTAAFFESRSAWRAYRPLGVVGVIADFEGENIHTVREFLNLMARRDLLFQAIWKSQLADRQFTGMKALLYGDTDTPAPAIKQRILSFVEQGGLLMGGPQWKAAGNPIDLGYDSIFQVRTHGKGRIASTVEPISDPWEVAVQAQLLVSYRSDLLKIYNSSSSGCTSYTASPDGKRAVLQGVSYADRRAGSSKTIWTRDNRGPARLWLIGGEPSTVAPQTTDQYAGVEYQIPEAASGEPYLALEWGA